MSNEVLYIAEKFESSDYIDSRAHHSMSFMTNILKRYRIV